MFEANFRQPTLQFLLIFTALRNKQIAQFNNSSTFVSLKMKITFFFCCRMKVVLPIVVFVTTWLPEVISQQQALFIKRDAFENGKYMRCDKIKQQNHK